MSFWIKRFLDSPLCIKILGNSEIRVVLGFLCDLFVAELKFFLNAKRFEDVRHFWDINDIGLIIYYRTPYE